MKHISPTFMYIIPMYLRLTTFTKTLLQCHFTYIFCYFISLWGSIMTLLAAGALTDPQLPATASNVCTTDARLGGVGQTKILATPVTPMPIFCYSTYCYHFSKYICDVFLPPLSWFYSASFPGHCSLHYSCLKTTVPCNVAKVFPFLTPNQMVQLVG